MKETDPILETEQILVRSVRPNDLGAIIRLDAKITGRRREEYFWIKLGQSIEDTGVQISLAAELDGSFAGFLLARVYYGEFGALEPSAVLDAIGVHPGFRDRGVGQSLLHQLRTNLKGLGIPRLQTEVEWGEQELLSFFHHEGFVPASRICLDLDLERDHH